MADLRRLAGRRALVTGAGSDGIGRAIASAFSREGASVVAHFHGTPLDDAERARMRGDDGTEITQLPADISDPQQARNMVRAAADRLHGLDVLVANAGITERIPFLDITDDAFDRLMAINLRGTFACCQEAARIMAAQQRGGRIIVVSSVNHDNVVPLQSHYCASKGGIRQLARAMALELAPHRIAVNLIAPAATMTDMVREAHRRDPEWSARVTAKYPMGRIGQPDDFRGPAVFLASDECSFMTGATLVVDGGFSLSR